MNNRDECPPPVSTGEGGSSGAPNPPNGLPAGESHPNKPQTVFHGQPDAGTYGASTRTLRWLQWLLTPLLFALGPVRPVGRCPIPASRGILVVANHLSDCDPIVLQYLASRPIRFMAKAPLFDLPVVRWVLKKWGVFPVNLQGGGGSGLRKAVSLMKAGEVVGIFPEGEISETGDFGTFKTGVGYIARLGGCPVLCVGLVRTNRIIPFAKIIPRPAFRKVEVRWGELIEYSKDADPEEVARDLERRVMALIR